MEDKILIENYIKCRKTISPKEIADICNSLLDKTNIKTILNLTDRFTRYPDFAYEIIKYLDDDEKKLIATRIYESANHKVPLFFDLLINNLEHSESKIEIITEYYLKYKMFANWFANELSLIDDDDTKISIINKLDISGQATLIASLKNEELKKAYVKDKKYRYNRLQIINSIDDKEFVKDILKKEHSRFIKYQIISSRIHNGKDIDDLLNYYGGKKVETLYKNLKNTQYVTLNENIDPSITIGVELECCHPKYEDFKILQVFNDFKVTEDVSVKPGFEIVSPILHYTKEDMSKLKTVCKALKKSHFFTNRTCGGHIHLGADYFKTKEELETFLYLYYNVESILFYITNKEGTPIRYSTKYYAKPQTCLTYKNITDRIYNKEHEINLYDLYAGLHFITGDRFNGINLTNLGNAKKNTIEFRMPNGNIEFEELKANIELFAKLFQVSKHLANPNKEELIKLKEFGEDIKEPKKLEMLLDLLFENEKDKEIYRRRYYENKKATFFVDIPNRHHEYLMDKVPTLTKHK